MAAALAYRTKDSSSDSDSGDSDKECLNWKRVTKNEDENLEEIPIVPLPSEPSHIQTNNTSSMKRKRNNIWSEVLEDQMMSESLTHIGIKRKPKNYGDRGEESYDYRLSKFYRDDNSDDELSDESRTSSRTYKKRFKSDKYVEIDADGAVAAKKIIKVLAEKKGYLIYRIVKYLGIEKAMAILKMTEDIEENGGMMIRNQERRRTPGGVFLHLLRNDDSIDKTILDKIFEGELSSYENKKKIAELRKKKKRSRTKRCKKSKNSMEIELSTPEKQQEVESGRMEADNDMNESPTSAENAKTSDLEEGEVE